MLPDSLTSPDLRIVIKYQAARIPAIAEADEAFSLNPWTDRRFAAW